MLKIGGRDFNCNGHTYVCGILNVTPDSFSDGSRFYDLDDALRHAEEMIRDGADVIDVGGESTRPGYTPVSDDEEISRIVPVIEGIRERFDVPVSLDTYKSSVASAGIEAGANLINDIWGLRQDPDMVRVVAEAGIPICLMHNRQDGRYSNFMTDVISELNESVQLAIEGGIPQGSIMLDPGVGFAKSYEQNLEVIAGLDRICSLGYPVMLGVSRKSVIGLTLGLDTDQRMEGTLSCCAWGMLHGASFLRVHDVREHVRLVRMMEAIRKYDEHVAYVSIGSNMGDKQAYVDKAIGLLTRSAGITVEKVSTMMETEPYGGVVQDNFLNGAIKIRTTLTPEELLDVVRDIEKKCDRVRTIHWGPRTLDMDILLYDDIILGTDKLTIPHRDMLNRAFVLDPMCEIAPYAVHPAYGETMLELRSRLHGLRHTN